MTQTKTTDIFDFMKRSIALRLIDHTKACGEGVFAYPHHVVHDDTMVVHDTTITSEKDLQTYPFKMYGKYRRRIIFHNVVFSGCSPVSILKEDPTVQIECVDKEGNVETITLEHENKNSTTSTDKESKMNNPFDSKETLEAYIENKFKECGGELRITCL